MAEEMGSVEVSVIFERLFSDYLAKQAVAGSLHLFLKKISALKEQFPILENMEVDSSGKASLTIRGRDTKTIVKTMSGVYDSLIDISVFTKGPSPAFEEARKCVESVQKQFETQFSKLRISDHILRGLLRNYCPTGIEGMDSLLTGGIPKGNAVLLLGPPGSEKHYFAMQFLAGGLVEGGSGIAVVSSMSVKEARSRLAQLKLNVSSCESRGALRFVDWYSHKSKTIIGVEEKGSVMVASKDMTNLDIALVRSLEKMEFSPTKRCVLDMITSALGMYSVSEVTEFMQRQKSRLKREGITTLFIVEHGALNERVLATLKHISDGVIVLSKDSKGKLFVQIESMEGGKFDPKLHPAQLSKKGLTVVGEQVDESGIISEFCSIPGIDSDIARNLVDTGFTDLEKLHAIENKELLTIQGVTEELATTILDYLGSIEYSQRVLAKKSERWLKKGIEQASAGENTRAKMSIQRALEIDQNNSAAWLELARLLWKEGNSAEAQSCFEKAKAIDPSASPPWLEERAPGGS